MKRSAFILFIFSFVLFNSSNALAQFKVHSSGRISFQSTTTTGGVQINNLGRVSFEPNITNSGTALTQTQALNNLVKAWNVRYNGNPPQMPFDRF